MTYWLLDRLYSTKDQPNASFAFNGSVNWVRALSLIVDSDGFSPKMIKQHYAKVNRRNANPDADTDSFEKILMSLHYVSALKSIKKIEEESYNLVRLAIISWYYSVYNASQAMISAFDGSRQETHKATSKKWHELVNSELVLTPFSFCLDDLREDEIERKISSIRKDKNAGTNNLGEQPKTEEEAFGALCSYLKGTAKYERDLIEKKIKDDRDFKKLGVRNFRTKDARNLRDSKLQMSRINFLTQAFRYRGKANYRDSIYLAYGDNMGKRVEILIQDLEIVSSKFLQMAAYYVSRKVEKNSWLEFVEDVNKNARFSINNDFLVF